MKKLYTVLLLIAFCVSKSYSQVISEKNLFPVGSYPISISYNYTTNLIFPFAIKGVDRGNQDVIVQKAKGIENILQVKAIKEFFQETNLSVITGDGKLYSFILNYSQQPRTLNYAIGESAPEKIEPIISEEDINQNQMEENSQKALEFRRSNIHNVIKQKGNVLAKVNALFVSNDVFYFRMIINNRSKINYDVEQVRFFIRDKKKAKRTASQEIELTPLNIYNSINPVEGGVGNVFIVALKKFTIPDKKDFVVQIIEKNGGRHLEMLVKNRHLNRVIVIK